MPAAMKMSSHPSALKSSTLGPQGQYVSTPTESETSSNRPPPRLANSSLPKKKRSFPPGIMPPATVAVSALRPSAVQSPGAMLTHISGCMLVTKTSSRPSPSKSNTFAPMEPQAGGVAHVPHARLRGDVAKRPMPEVLKQPIPMAHGRDEQVWITVVVDVGERAPHADRVGHAQPGSGGDVHEPAAADVFPELVGAELRHEIEIGETIAIDVRGAHAAPVVVVRELVGPAGVVDDPVLERDAAGPPVVREPEVVRHMRARSQLDFLARPLGQPRRGWGRAARGDEERECYEECGRPRPAMRHGTTSLPVQL